jgi:hypothetical protein
VYEAGRSPGKRSSHHKTALDQALKRQVQFGGRIGTNIVELRFLEEEELSKFLSRHFRLPAVSPEQLNDIPEEIVRSVSTEIVDKYKILPFRKERNRLSTAMLTEGHKGYRRTPL